MSLVISEFSPLLIRDERFTPLEILPKSFLLYILNPDFSPLKMVYQLLKLFLLSTNLHSVSLHFIMTLTKQYLLHTILLTVLVSTLISFLFTLCWRPTQTHILCLEDDVGRWRNRKYIRRPRFPSSHCTRLNTKFFS